MLGAIFLVFWFVSINPNAFKAQLGVDGDGTADDLGDDTLPWLQPAAADSGDDEFEPCESKALSSGVEYFDSGPVNFPDALATSDRAEYERDLALMRWEVEMLWELFYDDDGAKRTDPRRAKFGQYAEYVVNAVTMYQDNPTDIGGQLPKHKNVHLFFALIIAKESSVTNGVVGRLGEVGLMQLMPGNRGALAGYPASKVKNNPELNIFLGGRWLAYVTQECPGTDVFDPDWDDFDWVKPFSVYAGGMNAKRKDGTCRSFTIAGDRVRLVVMYRTRIDHLAETEYLTD